MRLTCPCCGCPFGIEAGVSDADARRFAAVLASLDPLVANPLIHYLALFRPPKRGLRWSRVLKLSEDLHALITAGVITRHRTDYRVTPRDWADALAVVVDLPKGLDLPLTSHGYLLEILASQAERRAAQAETQVEAQKRHTSRPSSPACLTAPQPVASREVAQAALTKMKRGLGLKTHTSPEHPDDAT